MTDDEPRAPGRPDLGGLGRVADDGPLTARSLVASIGGVRGIVETIVPTLLFVVLFQIAAIRLAPAAVPREVLALCVGVPLAAAVVFLVVRLVRHEPVGSAAGGLVVLGVSAVLALVTGNPNDNYLPGLIQNAAYGSVLLVSVLVRRPLIGVLVAFLMNDAKTWRLHAARRRVGLVTTLLWVALFTVRLLVEVPLYLAGDQTVALGIARIALGVPPYAIVLVVTVALARAVYRDRVPATG